MSESAGARSWGSLDSRNLPAWIGAVAVVCWGWSTGLWFLGLPMGLLLLAQPFLPFRVHLSGADFHRAFDVCWVLTLGSLLLIYSRESVSNLLRSFVQWLPLVVFPGVLAQVWSSAGRVPMTALIPWPRWRRRKAAEGVELDLGPVWVALCLLSMSASGGGGRSWFYLGLLIVLGFLVWGRRTHGGAKWKWGSLFAAAAAGGWFVAVGLTLFQQWVENGFAEWTTRSQRDSAQARESRTAIGRTGRIGGSTRIVARLRDPGLTPLPRYLRIGTYSEFQGDERWIEPRANFEKVEDLAEEWMLASDTNRLEGVLDVEWAQDATDSFLPLPPGTRAIRDLPAENVERTGFGAVRARVRGAVVSFRAEHGPQVSWEMEPGQPDRLVPRAERAVIQAFASDIGLHSGMDVLTLLQRLRSTFSSDFHYSTDLVDTGASDIRAKTPLGRFLLGNRTGHCEYFATAAVLLLRAMEVPARYATGFLVDPDERGGPYVTVRETHAHAWVRVWTETGWEDFDPTPAADVESAAQRTGWAARIARKLNEWRFGIARWWWLGEKPLLREAYWLTVPLLAVLLWRFRRLRTTSGSKDTSTNRWYDQDRRGLDSEWFEVEKQLAAKGLARGDLEPLGTWWKRLLSSGWETGEVHRASNALALHERLRFDPIGLKDDERARLSSLASEVLNYLRVSGEGPRSGVLLTPPEH